MHIALRVLAAAQALEKAAQRAFRPLGLTAAQFNVLNLLSDQPGGLRASDLARALIVDPSNVTGLLKRMTKDGLIQELENSADRRQHIVGLTARGRSAWGAANRVYTERLRVLDAMLTRPERTAAEKVLSSLAERAASLP
jgi:DNA-binding MarR family transcriptional regulator